MTVNKDQMDEIEALRSSKSETSRVTVPELEEIIYKPIPVWITALLEL